MRMGRWDGGQWIPTLAGWVWRTLKRHERLDPPGHDQATLPLFDDPPPRSRNRRASPLGKTRRERMEWAVKFLAGGHFELRTGDYRDDIGFDRSRKIVRVATRALADVYEVAVYMGVTIKDPGEIDWRPTHAIPEDFYA